MKSIVPYLYFALAGYWFYRSYHEYQLEPEVFNLFFTWNTESAATFIIFKSVIGILLILTGIRRLKMNTN